MRHPSRFFRWTLGLLLLPALILGALGGAGLSARAAPRVQSPVPGDVVISEFRTTGPNGANDEFIELHNRTNQTIPITNWRVRKSSGCGTTLTDLATIGVVSLAPGQYYLLGNSSGYTGIVDQTYTSSVSDDGGIALINDSNAIIDQVGMCSTTTYREATSLSPLSGTANQSYERKNNGCTDTNDNAADFVWNQTSSNPQNSSDVPIACLRVTNVTSTIADGIYIAGDAIPVTVTFSSNVNVTGLPVLLLETGATDRNAVYSSGSGSNTLTFIYTVVAGDFSDDLDYVSASSLSLNGGTITGAVGDANLTLPMPGTTGSLGANKDIVIDNQSPPSVISFTRQNPSANLTNADTLIFRAGFNEAVVNVDTSDFSAIGTTGAVTFVALVNSREYDVTISGGNLDTLNGIVGLNLSVTQDIEDAAGNPLPTVEPTIDETYTLDNIAPTVTINQASGQADPASGTPVNYSIVFSEPIDTSNFTVSDIAQGGTISSSLITWRITDSGDHQNFTLSAVSVAGNGTLIPSVDAGRVKDLAGNDNIGSTSTDNIVNFNDNVPPTVTIDQATGQTDPTSVFPINFNVTFSEPIIASIFTPSDITQSGTATGVTWSIIDSDDHQHFTLSATSVTGAGTLIPSIAANRVTDVIGNNNIASTSTDNIVTYIPPPTPTPTSTHTPTPSRTPSPSRTPTAKKTATVAKVPPILGVSEFLPRPGHDWNHDGKVDVYDEFIEIINAGTIDVDLSDYQLDDEQNAGSSPYPLPAITLKPGQRAVFYAAETGILLSDAGDSVRLLKTNNAVVDARTYGVVRYPDQSTCRIPDRMGYWNKPCFPTPGNPNALTGDFPPLPSTGAGSPLPVCLLPDTIPQEFVYAECVASGGGIWNRQFWDGYGPFELPLLNDSSKWGTIFE